MFCFVLQIERSTMILDFLEKPITKVALIGKLNVPGGVLPERYPTMSTRFSTYRGVILGLLHVHAIGVFKLSGFGKVQ